MITCTKCGQNKSREEMALDKQRRSGLSSWCRDCYANKQRKYRGTPSGIENKRKSNARYYDLHYDEVRAQQVDSRLRGRYGISLGERNRMLEEQGYACKVCGCLLLGDQNTHVDHDHETGLVRSLLCGGCNVKLGVLENRDWVAKAEKYLAEFAAVRKN